MDFLIGTAFGTTIAFWIVMYWYKVTLENFIDSFNASNRAYKEMVDRTNILIKYFNDEKNKELKKKWSVWLFPHGE